MVLDMTRFPRILTYLLFLVVMLTSCFPASAQWLQYERIPTPFIEKGKPVTLEAVVVKPRGSGPFPTLLFLHGSTGRGDDPQRFTRTWQSENLTRYFNDQGWMVVYPQRRGRGKSDGLYDEGFNADRSRYSCEPAESLAGVQRAIEDTKAITEWLRARPDVNKDRLLIGGQSRGGILAVAYAGGHAGQYRGVLNFVGGWMSDRCPDPKAINTATFAGAAAKAGVPTLWMYGQGDPFYSIEHSKSNFDAFIAAGGQGQFFALEPVGVENGHGILGNTKLWQSQVSAFVEQIK